MIRCRKRHVRGQALIFAVMIMLILLVVCFFLFDLQSIIRVRAKAQNGADAAALTAAAWQGKTLNLIGELNLIKASTVLLYGIPPETDEALPPAAVSREDLLLSVDLLTQMQTRLTYVGPLIGFAAAQQSAKNNGMRNVGLYTRSVDYHLRTWIDWQGGALYENIYGSDPRGIGYAWLPSYERMLEDVVSRGIAARPVNSRYLFGSPELVGAGGNMLSDPAFYRNVYARNYCWFYQRGLGPDAPPIDLSGIRYDITPEAWFPGSEFLPLYVEFATAPQQVHAAMAPHLLERFLLPLPPDQPGLPEITWAVYDLSGDGWGWAETGAYDFVNSYLRSNVRHEFTYGGPAARFITTANPALLSGRWSWSHGQAAAEEQNTSIGAAIGMGQAGRLTAAEQRLDALRQRESVESVGAAKAFGQVDGDPPFQAGVVLPVFTDVRLIPVSLVNSNLIEREPAFFRFLIDVFSHPDYPDIPDDLRQQYSWYLGAIDLYNNMQSSFRIGWWDFDTWRTDYMNGEDGIAGTDDDRRDPCLPTFTGSGPGGGSRGGPGIIH